MQEPYSYKGKIACVGSYSRILYNAVGGTVPRTCICTNLNCWRVDEFTCEDLTTVAVPSTSGKILYVASLYLDIEQPVENPIFTKLVEKCAAEQIPLIVGADTNAHGSMWGSLQTNKRGEDLEVFLLQNELYIANVGCVPTFDNGRSATIIDLTVHNKWAMDMVNDWRVHDDDNSLSDHKYLEYRIANYEPFFKVIRNFRTADWGQFGRSLSHLTSLTVATDSKSMDRAADELHDDIIGALDVACPLKRTLHRRPCRWWCAEVEQARVDLWEITPFRKHNIYYMALYKKRKAAYKRALVAAKRRSWRQFLNDAKSVKDVSKLVKILEGNKAGLNNSIALQKDEEGKFCSTPQESVKMLLSTHFPNYSDDIATADVDLEPNESCDEIAGYIDTHKVKASFNSFGPYKAAGADELKPIVLQKLPINMLDRIVDLYRNCIKLHYTPKAWREMKVIFIPKVGKKDYALAKAYRPITLSNFTLKGLERIVQWFILENNITRPLKHQHAYTKGLSTETALSNFVNDVESMVHRGKMTLAVSLDCSGAFDKIKFDSAKNAMRRLGIDENIIIWYDSMLRNRRVTADVQGCSMTIKPTQGSPQGGVLSPLVWNLIMDTLLSTFDNTEPVKVVGYADDILLYVSGADHDTLGKLMQMALNRVEEWGVEMGLTFCPVKTTAVMFERSRKCVHEPPIYMGGKKLSYSKSMKYLGLTISKRLVWTDHIDHKFKQCGYLLHKTRNVIGREWGLSPDKILWMHTAVIRPRISYAAVVWAHAINSTLEKKLDSIQRRSLTAITGCLTSTPTRALEVVVGIPPLSLYLREQACIARNRIRSLCSNDNWDGVGEVAKVAKLMGHRATWDKELNVVPETHWPCDDTTPFRNWNRNGSVNEGLVIYTDGSKMNNRTGSGWAVTTGDAVVAEGNDRLGDVSVFNAELIAIQSSLLWIDVNINKIKSAHGGVKILSDSQSGINSLFAPLISSGLVRDVAHLFNQVRNKIDLQIEWVRGHSDVTGNEYADVLAKGGTEADPVNVTPFMPTSRRIVKRAIKEHFDKKWLKLWRSCKGCNTAKTFLPEVSRKKVKKIPKLGRGLIADLCQIVTGHGFFGGHMWYWCSEIDPTCKLCGEDAETSLHWWTECKALDCYRNHDSDQKSELNNIINFFRCEPITDVVRGNRLRWQRRPQLQHAS